MSPSLFQRRHEGVFLLVLHCLCVCVMLLATLFLLVTCRCFPIDPCPSSVCVSRWRPTSILARSTDVEQMSNLELLLSLVRERRRGERLKDCMNVAVQCKHKYSPAPSLTRHTNTQSGRQFCCPFTFLPSFSRLRSPAFAKGYVAV